MNKKRETLLSIFGALCFFLSAVEFLIPKPLPFLRIGLSNVPLLLGAKIFSFPDLLLLAIIKIIGQGIINGTLFSYIILFSFAGTAAAVLTIALFSKVPPRLISFTGISIAASFASNCAQLIVGYFVVFGSGVIYISPVFLAIGLITGLCIGIFCGQFVRESAWYQEILYDDYAIPISIPTDYQQADHPILRTAVGLFLIFFLWSIPLLLVKIIIFIAALLLCIAEKQQIRWGYLIASIVGIMLCYELFPMGRIIFSIGSIVITADALRTGFEKAIIFSAMIYLSRWMMQVHITLPGMLGSLLQKSLYLFSVLLELNKRIRPKHFLTDIDELLLSLPFAHTIENQGHV
ncbi:MAG: Gx transporter family protein [Treponema sp.]